MAEHLPACRFVITRLPPPAIPFEMGRWHCAPGCPARAALTVVDPAAQIAWGLRYMQARYGSGWRAWRRSY